MKNKILVNFLQIRETPIDLKPFEEKCGITLPPIYRSFLSIFNPKFVTHQVLENGRLNNFIFPIYSSLELKEYTGDDDELTGLDSFRDIDHLEHDLIYGVSNDGYYKDLLYIANHGCAGGLLLGIGEDNKDKIFCCFDGETVEFIAENIFEIIGRIKLVYFDITERPDLKKMYKNWDEDFWRVREDE